MHADYSHLSTDDQYYSICSQVCNDQEQRQKYFPMPVAVRRIRAWAGSEVPESVAAELRQQPLRHCTWHRPFRVFKPPKVGYFDSVYQSLTNPIPRPSRRSVRLVQPRRTARWNNTDNKICFATTQVKWRVNVMGCVSQPLLA